MRKLIPITVTLLFAFGGLWATAQPKPSPELEAVGAKLMQEINAGIQCNVNAIAGRQELEKLQAELKALKAKYEPEEKKDAK